MSFETGRTLKGWGVVRGKPWHLAGVYETKEEAEAKAQELGSDYEAHFGENQEGTDNFIWTTVK